MATYEDLRTLFNHNELLNKIAVACIVAAEAIRTEAPSTTNHANRLVWAKAAFVDTKTIRKHMLMAVLAANKTLDVSAITGASDASIQSTVNSAVDVLADGS